MSQMNASIFLNKQKIGMDTNIGPRPSLAPSIKPSVNISNYPPVADFPLVIPFSLKDSLKLKYKLRWNPENKTWNAPNITTFNLLSKFHIVKLDVDFSDKGIVKKLGAQWNGNQWIISKEKYEQNINTLEKYYDEDQNDVDDDEEAL